MRQRQGIGCDDNDDRAHVTLFIATGVYLMDISSLHIGLRQKKASCPPSTNWLQFSAKIPGARGIQRMREKAAGNW
jgi:hypothetical protein